MVMQTDCFEHQWRLPWQYATAIKHFSALLVAWCWDECNAVIPKFKLCWIAQRTKVATLPKVFSLLDLSVPSGVPYKKRFMAIGETWLLVVPKDRREGVLHARHDEPIAGHLCLGARKVLVVEVSQGSLLLCEKFLGVPMMEDADLLSHRQSQRAKDLQSKESELSLLTHSLFGRFGSVTFVLTSIVHQLHVPIISHRILLGGGGYFHELCHTLRTEGCCHWDWPQLVPSKLIEVITPTNGEVCYQMPEFFNCVIWNFLLLYLSTKFLASFSLTCSPCVFPNRYREQNEK